MTIKKRLINFTILKIRTSFTQQPHKEIKIASYKLGANTVNTYNRQRSRIQNI